MMAALVVMAEATAGVMAMGKGHLVVAFVTWACMAAFVATALWMAYQRHPFAERFMPLARLLYIGTALLALYDLIQLTRGIAVEPISTWLYAGIVIPLVVGLGVTAFIGRR
jgi:hypothetical protein